MSVRAALEFLNRVRADPEALRALEEAPAGARFERLFELSRESSEAVSSDELHRALAFDDAARRVRYGASRRG